MINRFSLKALFVLVFAFAMISCQKGATEPLETSKKDLLVGSWQMTGHIETPATYDFEADGVKDSDTYKYMGSCFTDNFLTFKSDGTCEANEGPTKCEPTDVQIETTRWSLSGDGKTLTVDDESMTILDLTANTMKVTYTDFVIDTNITYVVTLKKI